MAYTQCGRIADGHGMSVPGSPAANDIEGLARRHADSWWSARRASRCAGHGAAGGADSGRDLHASVTFTISVQRVKASGPARRDVGV